MKISFAVLVFTVFANCVNARNMRKEIQKVINDKNAIVGIAVYDYSKDKMLQINGSKHFPMQSVFKFPVVLKVLDEVDRGNIRLSDSVFVRREELYDNTWSPIRDKYPDGNVSIALRDIIYYTIAQSDNNGCDILLRLAGGASSVEAYLLSQGISDMRVEKTEAEQHENPDMQYENWTTPLCAIKLLKMFDDKQLLTHNSHDFLWNTMSKTSTGSIQNELPDKVIVAHKTGSAFQSGHYVTNDIGIMRLSDKDVIYAIFIMDSQESKETNYKIISDIGKIIYDYQYGKNRN